MAAYEAVIGLEVHVQLATASKLFCSCSTRFGQPPNTNVCEVCAGMPGALPVPNRQAVHYAALVAHIPPAPSTAHLRLQPLYPRIRLWLPDPRSLICPLQLTRHPISRRQRRARHCHLAST